MKQAHAGEAHGHAVLIGGGNDVVVPNGPAGLDDVLHAALPRPLHVISEGEEGVGPAGHAGELCDPGFFRLRRQGLGALLKDGLPRPVRQKILPLVGEVDVDGIVPVRTADAVHTLQLQWMRLCWPAPTPMAWPSFT